MHRHSSTRPFPLMTGWQSGYARDVEILDTPVRIHPQAPTEVYHVILQSGNVVSQRPNSNLTASSKAVFIA